jgi:hypothetical protein
MRKLSEATIDASRLAHSSRCGKLIVVFDLTADGVLSFVQEEFYFVEADAR